MAAPTRLGYVSHNDHVSRHSATGDSGRQARHAPRDSRADSDVTEEELLPREVDTHLGPNGDCVLPCHRQAEASKLSHMPNMERAPSTIIRSEATHQGADTRQPMASSPMVLGVLLVIVDATGQ